MMMASNVITTLLSFFGFCSTTTEDRIKRALLTKKKNLDPFLCEALLAWDQEDDQYDPTIEHELHNTDDEKSFRPLFRGLPKQPLYRELARRLDLLSSTTKPMTHDPANGETTTTHPLLLVPASLLKFQEYERPPLPLPVVNVSEDDWLLQQAGNDGVLHILGMRSTIGTAPGLLLPPSWSSLVKAANQIHKQKLSVAARARAKHAHRGADGSNSSSSSFFGGVPVKGSPESQNVVAEQVVLKLLREAIWVNIHTFGGMNEQPVLEIRVMSGYGARWACEYSSSSGDNKNQLLPTSVVFRGFLEPQMENGHLVKWRHHDED